MHTFYIKITTLLALCFAASLAQAQSAADIMDRMIQEYSNSISGIETMMMITQMEGFLESDEPDTAYYRKVTMEDGTNTMQLVASGNDTPGADYYNFKQNYDAIVENATYQGTETIDGRNAHVLFIEDVSALYSGAVVGMDEHGGEAQSGRFFIDTSTNMMLRMSFDMNFDGEHTGAVDINMKDFRNIDGMNIPFATEMRIDGISEQFSAEDLAEARKGMEELQRQIDNASGIQKRIMESAILPQIERFAKMLEEDGMAMRTVTLAVETNIALPE